MVAIGLQPACCVPQPPLGQRRALFLSGMYGSEVVELIAAYREAGARHCGESLCSRFESGCMCALCGSAGCSLIMSAAAMLQCRPVACCAPAAQQHGLLLCGAVPWQCAAA